MKITKAQAAALGFEIDNHANLGYKGARFAPTETVLLYSDLECSLLTSLHWLANCSSDSDGMRCEAQETIDEFALGFKP